MAQKEKMDCAMACAGMMLKIVKGMNIPLHLLKLRSLNTDIKHSNSPSDKTPEAFATDSLGVRPYQTELALRAGVLKSLIGYRPHIDDANTVRPSVGALSRAAEALNPQNEFAGTGTGNVIQTLKSYGLNAGLRYVEPGEKFKLYLKAKLEVLGEPVIAIVRRMEDGVDKGGHQVVLDGVGSLGSTRLFCILDPSPSRMVQHCTMNSVVESKAKGAENGKAVEMVENGNNVWVFNGWFIEH